MLERLLTEQRNPDSERLDELSTEDVLRVIHREDRKVAAAVEEQIPHIARAVGAIYERYRGGGRLFYVGAGTSGRLGALDAAECPPTFGIDPERVQALIAGGERAMFRPVEGAEDDSSAGARDLEGKRLTAADSVVGLTASGRAPYVLGAVDHARQVGALTVGVSCTPNSELARRVEIAITPLAGPEVVTGSTRMKAGTAQKLVLNMISTALMVRMGYVFGNLMIHVSPVNEKLADRARRIVAALAGCGAGAAARALEGAAGDVRVAAVAARRGVAAEQARHLLEQSGGDLRKALQLPGGSDQPPTAGD